LIVVAVLVLAAYYLLGHLFFRDYALDLGSVFVPTPGYVTVVELWCVFGGAASVLLTLGLVEASQSSRFTARAVRALTTPLDRHLLLGACVVAFAIPLAIRIFLLQGAPLTDDEGAYRFAAQLLASGRLRVASPEFKLFFDQNFMINDGHLYPAYFMGWPALLAVGLRAGVPSLVNPLLSALTLPPLASVLKRVVGPQAVRLGVLVFLCSPFVQMTAATQLSHTACLLALTCALALACCATERFHAAVHAGLGFCLAAAFFIRPQATAPLAIPLMVSWVSTVYRLPRRQRSIAVAAFLAAAVPLAMAFLWVLHRQNGSTLVNGYSRYSRYLVENGFRFSTFSPRDLTSVVGFDFSDVGGAVLRTIAGVVRLNFDLFGWPSSLALLAFAVPLTSKHTRLLWSMVAMATLSLFFQRDWGIDSFGPVHAFELTLPVLVLTIAGAMALGHRLSNNSGGDVSAQRRRRPAVPALLVTSLTICSCAGFIPVRFAAVRKIAEQVNRARLAPQGLGIHRAIVFAPLPFVPRCKGSPAHFVLFHPPNDPDLLDDVLWVNDVGTTENQTLLSAWPQRRGFRLLWNADCQVELRAIRPTD
jgi:hypothetical protein